jgi:hypothetical protein
MKNEKITSHRRSKTVEELKMKRDKAMRKGFFTVEDIDYAIAYGRKIEGLFNEVKNK